MMMTITAMISTTISTRTIINSSVSKRVVTIITVMMIVLHEMAQANKGLAMQVLVGTHVVLANGGIMAPVGTHVVALAAKHHSCPFVVLTGLHKLSPLFPHDPSVTFNDFRVRSP